MISIRNAGLNVAGRPLLRDLTFDVGSGEVVAVVGPNGAGKTTLLRAVAAQHPVASGCIVVDGEDLRTLTPVQRARRIAFVGANDVDVEAVSVRDVVATGRYPHHRWWEWREDARDSAAIASALARVGMDSFCDRFFSTLSSGERRNVWIALALAQETAVLALDEPTTHLDVRVAQRMLATLRGLARAGKTVLCSLHDLNEAAACADRLVLIGEGSQRAAGPPAEVLAGAALDETYRTALRRVLLPDGSVRVFAEPYPAGAVL